ncbi:MAG: AraC family transcriptional regulator [Planctomycetota bacterium]|jgi:AraC family transcriptional regulator
MTECDDARKKALRAEYVGRINRVIDYIEANLDRELSLGALARVASFSPYHFHRVFKGVIGETLNRFIQRRRVEKAASMLVSNPAKAITEVAFDCGFSGSAAFARSFKEFFGVSASEWRRTGGPMQSNNCKTNSKMDKANSNTRKDETSVSYTIDLESGNYLWRLNMDTENEVNVEVKEMPEMHVAYVRHIGPYKGDSALFERLFGKLCSWAGPRGLIRPPETKFMSIYYDDPDITDQAKLRVDVCITVPEGTPVDGEIGRTTVPGGKYAVGHFELLPNEYEDAWNAIMGGWLPESGYQCDDRPCFESYLNDPKEHPEGKCIVDINVPVKPL